LRDRHEIKSGTQNDIGCHHAEINAILNAARTGTSTLGKWLFTSCDPCLMCAKSIHHAGIVKVFTPLKSHKKEGLIYLKEHNVEIVKH
jgi:dCMP deaminase